MATVADDFNRANGSLGANWTAPNFAIVSNAADVTSADIAIWNTSYPANQWAQADVTLNHTSAVGAGVFCRHQTTGSGSRYVAEWWGSSGGFYQIWKQVNGDWSAIATSSTGVGTTGTRTIKLVVIGTSLEMFVNGSSVLTVTDSSVSGTGQIGMTTDSNAPVFDNFSAGDWVIGAGSPTLVRVAGAGSGASTASGTTGSGTPTLSRYTGAGSGTSTPAVTGTSAATLTRSAAVGTGSTGAEGSSATTLPRHIGAGSGATTGIVGSGASTLTRHATAAAGSTGTTGAAAATLTGRAAAGAGSTTAPGGSGSGTPTLTRHTATGVGSTGTTGAGSPTCTRHTALGSGSTGLSGSAGVALIRSTVTGSGTCTQPGAAGSGNPTLTPRTGGGTGSTGTTGTGTLLLERHTATGGTQAHSYAPAHAIHRIPAERRTLEILAEDRATIIPAERRTLEITHGI